MSFLFGFTTLLLFGYSYGKFIECPGDVYFFVNTTSTGDRETFIRIKADSFDHCRRLCYGNHFCFSAIYDPDNKNKQCAFSYFSAYNCSYKTLVTKYEYEGGKIVVECLKCPSRGDLIKPPEVVFATVQGITSKITQEPPRTNEQTTVTTTQQTTTKSSTSPPTTKSETLPPETTDITTLEPIEATDDKVDGSGEIGEGSGQEGSGEETEEENIEGHTLNSCSPDPCPNGLKCIPESKECIRAPCPQYKCENVKESGALEATPQSLTKKTEEQIKEHSAKRLCENDIFFSVIPVPDNDRSNNPVFSDKILGIDSIPDCARICYEVGCTVAGFVPDLPNEQTPGGSCLVAFGKQSQPQVDCDQLASGNDVDDSSNATLIVCINCAGETFNLTGSKVDIQPDIISIPSKNANGQAVVVSPETFTNKPLTAQKNGTIVDEDEIDNKSEQRSNESDTDNINAELGDAPKSPCVATFEVEKPDYSLGLKIQKRADAHSAQHCAQLCYDDGKCKLVGWSPNLRACLLLDGVTSDRCTFGDRYFQYLSDTVIWIKCIKIECDASAIDGAESVIKQFEKEVTQTTSKATKEAKTTTTPIVETTVKTTQKTTVAVTTKPTTTEATTTKPTTTEPTTTKATTTEATTTKPTTTTPTTTKPTTAKPTTTEPTTAKPTTTEPTTAKPTTTEPTTAKPTTTEPTTTTTEKETTTQTVQKTTERSTSEPTTESTKAPTTTTELKETTTFGDGNEIGDERIKASVEETPDSIPKRVISDEVPSIHAIPGECVVSFKVDYETDTNGMNFNKEYELSSANNCARLCITLSCTAAEFVPSFTTDKKHKCRMQLYTSDPERCAARLQTQYSLSNANRVLLSCFRCVPYDRLPVTKPPTRIQLRIDEPKTEKPVEEDKQLTDTPTTTVLTDAPTTVKTSPSTTEQTTKPTTTTKLTTIILPQTTEEVTLSQTSPTTKVEEKTTVADVKTTVAIEKESTVAPVETTEAPKIEESTTVKTTGTTTEEEEATTVNIQAAIAPKIEEKPVPVDRPSTKGIIFKESGPLEKQESTSGFYDCLLVFQVAPLYAYPIDDSVDFTASKQTETATECARFCFLSNCIRVGYDPLSKLCLFSTNDPIQCQDYEYTPVHQGPEQVWLQCIQCLDNTTSHRFGSIVVSAEDRRKAQGGFTVEPLTTKALPTKVGITEVTTPTSTEKITKQPIKTNKPVKVTIVTTKEPQVLTTPEVTSTAPEVEVTGTTSGSTSGRPSRLDVTDGCVIAFQVEEGVGEKGVYERKTMTLTAANCARRCFGVGCSEARFIPTTGECQMNFGPVKRCRAEALVPVHRGVLAVALTCLRCVSSVDFRSVEGAEIISGSSIDQTPQLKPAVLSKEKPKSKVTDEPSGIDTTTLDVQTAKPTIEVPTKVNSTRLPLTNSIFGDCVVTFEIAQPEPALGLKFSKKIDAREAGDCAQLCFVDGCTMAAWSPNLRSCIFSYDEDLGERCVLSRRYHSYQAENVVWLQCLRCVDEYRPGTGPSIATTDPSLANVTLLRKEDSENTTEASTKSTADDIVAATDDDTTELADKATTELSESEPPTTKEPPTVLPAIVPTPIERPVSQRTCSGTVSFQVGEPIMDDAKYMSDTTVTNTQQCAKRCFEVDCEMAVYVPEQKQCLLYDGPKVCDRTTTMDDYNNTNVVRVQCIICEALSIDSRPNLADSSKEIQSSTTDIVSTNATSTTELPQNNITSSSKIDVTTEDDNQTASNGTGVQTDTAELIDAVTRNIDKENVVEILNVEPSDNNKVSSQDSCKSNPCPDGLKCLEENKKCVTSPCQFYQCVNTTQDCNGRLIFQIQKVDNLPRLNITNDVPAESPADCARKCWQKPDCTVAGYLPNYLGGTRQGVCLLTRDQGMCLSQLSFTAQHAAATPFAISCIKCSGCQYSLRRATPTGRLPQLEIQKSANSLTECAEKCHDIECSSAVYSSRSSTGNCLLAKSGEKNCNGTDENAIDTLGPLPVLMDCVQCGL